MEKLKRFYKLKYAVLTAIVLAIIIGFFLWNNFRKTESAKQRAMKDCFSSCMSDRAEKNGFEALDDPSVMSECTKLCRDQYGEYK